MTLPGPLLQVWSADGSTPVGVLAGFIAPVISDVLCGVASLRFSVPRSVLGASLLLDPAIDRQIRVVQPGSPDQWFLLDEDAFEGVSEDAPTEVVDVTCRGMAAVLDEAVVYPNAGPGLGPAIYALMAPTPGRVVASLFAAAQDRGLLQGLTVDGDEDTDADGIAWDSMPDTVYRAGTTLLSVLTGLSDQKLLEWRMHGRTLELFVPDGGLDRDRDLTLRPRREVASAPVTNSRRSVATDVLIEGADENTESRTQALANRRRREVYVSQTSAPSGSLSTIGDLYLAAHNTADRQMTHKLIDSPGSVLPWVDYRPGDRVLTPVSGSAIERQRIRQIAVDFEAGEITVELGSLLETAEERFARQLSRLLPGESSLT